MGKRNISARHGIEMSCKGWQQEAALRMLMNNLDQEVAENPDELVVYGGSGKAARNWKAYDSIISCLKRLEDEETLLIQSGKPVAIFKSHKDAPRVLLANSNLVPYWANWDKFRDLERMGLMMYGQMTAGSWIYIGTQGILQGTYETFAAAGKKHFASDLAGKLVLSAGLGGMGGAQPLAVKMNKGVFIGVEIDRTRIEKRIKTGYCDIFCDSIDDAINKSRTALKSKTPLSIGLLGNAADLYPEFLKRGLIPDLVTDQTSAHDILNGYVPNNFTLETALRLRKENPELYQKESLRAIKEQVEAMLAFRKAGSFVFDYGNNIRLQAQVAGLANAFDFPGFVPAYIRPLFCQGKGPFRWVALSGDPEDIYTTDRELLQLFPENETLCRWIKMAQESVHFQGLPARICWLGYGEREKAGLLFNRLVRDRKVKAPIVIGRDHLDCGSVASPYRETESMLDKSDAIADWPILNALINAVNGATWVSFHHGGGVGIGFSLHAGMVILADGTEDCDSRLSRVLKSDPGMGVVRHADAGYQEAIEFAKKSDLKIPEITF